MRRAAGAARRDFADFARDVAAHAALLRQAPGLMDLKRILIAAAISLLIGCAFITLAVGTSDSWMVGALQRASIFAAGAVVIFGGMAWIALRMANYRGAPETEAEFEEVVERSERLASTAAIEAGDSDLGVRGGRRRGRRATVGRARPPRRRRLRAARASSRSTTCRSSSSACSRTVPVVVSDKGRRRRAYGLYEGDGVARDNYPDRIIIFRDTLVRDFGHDADLLRAQVTQTVRHEVAHHLGWDERGVEGLGL